MSTERTKYKVIEVEAAEQMVGRPNYRVRLALYTGSEDRDGRVDWTERGECTLLVGSVDALRWWGARLYQDIDVKAFCNGEAAP